MEKQIKTGKKINGYSFRDFEKIGISSQKLYRAAREGKTEEELAEEVFRIKFGKSGTKKERMLLYYKIRLLRIKNLPLRERTPLLQNIKRDLYLTGELMKIGEITSDKIWTEVVKTFVN